MRHARLEAAGVTGTTIVRLVEVDLERAGQPSGKFGLEYVDLGADRYPVMKQTRPGVGFEVAADFVPKPAMPAVPSPKSTSTGGRRCDLEDEPPA